MENTLAYYTVLLIIVKHLHPSLIFASRASDNGKRATLLHIIVNTHILV